MSVVTPAPMSASRSPFIHLVTDPWILVSWLLFIGTGSFCVLMQLQNPTASSLSAFITTFLATGYISWAAYHGLAGCWRFVIGRLRGIASAGFGLGCFSMITVGWMFLAFAFVYAWFGGGIYQFARRWWLLAHGQRPPFLTAKRQVAYL